MPLTSAAVLVVALVLGTGTSRGLATHRRLVACRGVSSWTCWSKHGREPTRKATTSHVAGSVVAGMLGRSTRGSLTLTTSSTAAMVTVMVVAGVAEMAVSGTREWPSQTAARSWWTVGCPPTGVL